jgi:poly(3-hydroxyalkanoate) depolymerase
VRVLGHDIRVSVRRGADGGTPLVLCNGIGASLDLLEPFVAALPPEIEVVSFDVPGVGGSALPRLPYNFAALSVLLGRLLTELGYEQVDVLGISWGGGLAQQFAFQNPRRCRRLVLVSTGTGYLMIPAHPRVLSTMLTPRRYRDREFAVSVAANLYGGDLRANPQLVQRLLHDQSRLGSRRGYLLQLAAGAGWTSLPFLPMIRQPTLVLAGNDDPIIPLANARMINRLIPHSRLHVFDDGHLGLVTRAAELGPVVAGFLRDPD